MHVNMEFWYLKRTFSFGLDHPFESFGNDEKEKKKEEYKGDDYSWLFGDKEEDGEECVISDDDFNCNELDDLPYSPAYRRPLFHSSNVNIGLTSLTTPT